MRLTVFETGHGINQVLVCEGMVVVGLSTEGVELRFGGIGCQCATFRNIVDSADVGYFLLAVVLRVGHPGIEVHVGAPPVLAVVIDPLHECLCGSVFVENITHEV